MTDRIWQSSVNSVIVTSPTRPADRPNGETWAELVPVGPTFTGHCENPLDLLRVETERADRAEAKARIAHRAGYELARLDAAKSGWHLLDYDVIMAG